MIKNSYKNIRKKERKLCLIAMCFCTTDFKKIKTTLPRSCDEEYFISLASKRWLTDKIVVNKQQIRPASVSSATEKLKINPFCHNVIR